MLVTNSIGMGDPFFCKFICPQGVLEGAIPLSLGNAAIRSALGKLKEICRRRLDEGVVLWRYSQWHCRGSGGFLSCRLPRRKAHIGKGLDNGRPVAAQCRQRVEKHLLADGFERFRTVGHEHSRLRGA